MGAERTRRARTVMLIAAMAAILLVFTLPLWSSRNLLYMGDIANSDVTELNYPARKLLADSLRSWNLPVWNPYIGCGFPQLAEGQSGMLYPPNLILFRLLDTVLAFNLGVILSLFLSLVFCYLLFRHYGISRPASLFAATAFTFSGFVMAKLKFTYMINCVCWIPLAVYGVEKALSAKRPLYLLLTTLALSMQVLAGGPQIFLITTVAVAVAFAWRFLPWVAGGEKGAYRAAPRDAAIMLAGILLCVLLSLAIAAPQLLPQLQGYPYSERSHTDSFGATLVKPMRPRNLVQFVSPYQYGNPARATYDLDYDYFWENIAYPGLLTLVLALVALLFLVHRDSILRMWMFIAVVALVLSFAAYLPLAEWLWKYVPGFKLFRFWQRFLVLVVLAVSLFAGKGLDLVLSRFREKRWWYGFAVILVFVVALTDLALFSYNQVSTIDSRRLTEENRTAQWLRERLPSEGGDYRIAVLGTRELWKEIVDRSGGWLGGKELFYSFMELVPPNHNSLFKIYGEAQYGDYGLYRIKLLDTFSDYSFLRQSGWEADIPRSALNILAVEGVKYLVSPMVLDEEGLLFVDSFETGEDGIEIRIYELTSALPRAYIVQGYEKLEIDDSTIRQQVLLAMFDPEKVRERVVLEVEPALSYGPGEAGEAHITHADDRKVVVEASSPGGGLLVLSDAYYPEWQVNVDGRQSEILRANFAFRAVELEPGEHIVEFTYRPSGINYGFLISIASILLLILLVVWDRKARPDLDTGSSPGTGTEAGAS